MERAVGGIGGGGVAWWGGEFWGVWSGVGTGEVDGD